MCANPVEDKLQAPLYQAVPLCLNTNWLKPATVPRKYMLGEWVG